MAKQFCYYCERFIDEPNTSDSHMYAKFWYECRCFHCNNKFIDFFEVPVSKGDGYCSDNECPCYDVKIPRGTGYLFIPEDTVYIRRNYKSASSFQEKMNDLPRQTDMKVVFEWGIILLCEKGANFRGLNLQIAAKDSRIWWKTGLVPLRSTPMASIKNRTSESKIIESYKQNPKGKIWLPEEYEKHKPYKKSWWKFWKKNV